MVVQGNSLTHWNMGNAGIHKNIWLAVHHGFTMLHSIKITKCETYHNVILKSYYIEHVLDAC